jgi:hypothetical protein
VALQPYFYCAGFGVGARHANPRITRIRASRESAHHAHGHGNYRPRESLSVSARGGAAQQARPSMARRRRAAPFLQVAPTQHSDTTRPGPATAMLASAAPQLHGARPSRDLLLISALLKAQDLPLSRTPHHHRQRSSPCALPLVLSTATSQVYSH